MHEIGIVVKKLEEAGLRSSVKVVAGGHGHRGLREAAWVPMLMRQTAARPWYLAKRLVQS